MSLRQSVVDRLTPGRARALVAGGVALTLVGAVVSTAALTRPRSAAQATFEAPSVTPAADSVEGFGPSAGPSGSASAGPSTSAAVPGGKAAHGGTGAKLRGVDGGTGYYRKFSPALPTDPSFFPVAVWFESVLGKGDVDTDRDAGLNTYLELTRDSDRGVVRAAGMYAITSGPHEAGPETVGWLLPDEVDMWGGPGAATWTGRYPGEGDVCQPADAKCGYTVQQKVRAGLPGDGRLRFSNYGKGVAFWQNDSEASKFVNEFQDVLSADTYWFTDLNICGVSEGAAFFDVARLPADACHRASNYGRTVSRLRSLVKPAGSKPVWGFVEVGHPFTEGDWPSAKPEQVTAGVWSSIIHGARGIVYFNHSFAGSCQTQHALRDPCYRDMRAAVKKVNGQIRAMAPVLNAPFADGVVKGSGGVDVATRWYDGNFYVLAGANQSAAQTATFALPCVGAATVTVLDENRTITVANGTFTDRFADSNAVHRYRVDGGSSCGAY
jgi:hypothetical protein